MKSEFVPMQESEKNALTTAQIVGVDKGEQMFKKAIPPSQTHAFFGTDMPASTNEEYESNQRAQQAYRDELKAQAEAVKVQDR